MPDHARRPRAGHRRRPVADPWRDVRHRRRDRHRDPRHHADHECPDRAPRRPHRPACDRGVPRHGRDRHRGPLRQLRPGPADAEAAGAAQPALRHSRAHRRRRVRRRAAGRGRGARRRPQAPGDGGRGGGDLVPACLPRRPARTRGRGDPCRDAARRAGQPVQPGGPRDPRIRTHQHHRGQCLCPADRADLPGPRAGPAEGRGLWQVALHDGFVGRGRLGGYGQETADPDAGIRPHRRRPCRRLFLAQPRASQPRDLRHGRHDREDRPGQGSRGEEVARVRVRPGHPLHARQRSAGEGADDRADRDRRRAAVRSPMSMRWACWRSARKAPAARRGRPATGWGAPIRPSPMPTWRWAISTRTTSLAAR